MDDPLLAGFSVVMSLHFLRMFPWDVCGFLQSKPDLDFTMFVSELCGDFLGLHDISCLMRLSPSEKMCLDQFNLSQMDLSYMFSEDNGAAEQNRND